MGILDKVIKVFVGDKSKKDIGQIQPIVNEIKKHEAALEKISHDELRAKTEYFRNTIKDAQTDVQKQIHDLQKQSEEEQDINKKEEYYNQIDKLKDDLYEIEKTTLNKILPEAFAVMKETAKRFKNNETITVSASPFDREISSEKEYVTLEDDKAIWKNSWDAAGKPITWDMVHYDVQLIGGIALHEGKVAEMQTGEGKTLVATLPMYLRSEEHTS